MDSNSSSFTESFAKILYGGINPNIPGHGGEVCAKYLDSRKANGIGYRNR